MPSIKVRTPLVELPLGATEDRICGTIDIEKALTEGVKAYEPGLLVGATEPAAAGAGGVRAWRCLLALQLLLWCGYAGVAAEYLSVAAARVAGSASAGCRALQPLQHMPMSCLPLPAARRHPPHPA